MTGIEVVGRPSYRHDDRRLCEDGKMAMTVGKLGVRNNDSRNEGLGLKSL
ncbi:hypothetical protein HMPREF9062_1751 [Actinomyces sp. oral taxon 448 str. F0400]|nr:hypothetical protein HMPREF9062_1751 [Actinomyces sp. oral taxon 448 str. F0400]